MRLPRLAGAEAASRAPDWPRQGADPSADTALLGSWAATRWQYASMERQGKVVDVVVGLGGSVTISLSAGAYVLTWDVPGHGSGSIGGSAAQADGRLLLRPDGVGEGETLDYQIASQTLALSSGGSSWDFDGDGAEAAEFVAVLVRL